MSFFARFRNSKPAKLPSLLLAALLFLSASPVPAQEISAENKVFLEKIQKDSLKYFLQFAHERTGLTWDSSRPGSPASTAAIGFGLASIAVAYEHGWLTRDDAYQRIRKALRWLEHKAQHERGFFYHFIDARTGLRAWYSEASSIDTALLIAGALLAARYFPGTEIETLANALYERVDWEWMLNGSDLICMGWKPESGFLPYYWDSYSELIVMQALAIGSPTHPIPSSLWENWNRFEDEFDGKTIVYSHSGSLFTYQYSHAFIDFRKIDDQGIDYFQNSVNASLANRNFSLTRSSEYKTYAENVWGLTACFGPKGYRAYGAEPGQAIHDGTIAPSGSAGSIVFAPEESIAALKHMYETHYAKLYGDYGFKDSFNLDMNWFCYDYLGIDQGVTFLMIENYLTGKVWERFMELPSIKKWMSLCALEKKSPPLEAITNSPA